MSLLAPIIEFRKSGTRIAPDAVLSGQQGDNDGDPKQDRRHIDCDHNSDPRGFHGRGPLDYARAAHKGCVLRPTLCFNPRSWVYGLSAFCGRQKAGTACHHTDLREEVSVRRSHSVSSTAYRPDKPVRTRAALQERQPCGRLTWMVAGYQLGANP